LRRSFDNKKTDKEATEEKRSESDDENASLPCERSCQSVSCESKQKEDEQRKKKTKRRRRADWGLYFAVETLAACVSEGEVIEGVARNVLYK